MIVLTQLPISRSSEGRRRTRLLALLGVLWAASWLLVPIAGIWLAGASAALLLGAAMSLFGVGECLHGAVQGPLVADLAEPRLYGRYMALSALSWSVGFALGPAIGGPCSTRGRPASGSAPPPSASSRAPLAALDPRLPAEARRTPVAV